MTTLAPGGLPRVVALACLLLPGLLACPSGSAPRAPEAGADSPQPTPGSPEGGAAGGAAADAVGGLRLMDQGDYAGAEPLLLRALAAHPRDARLLEALAYAYGHTDRWQKAEETYRQALAVRPQSPGALLGLANTLADTGRYPEALRSVEDLLSVDPRNVPGLLRRSMLLERLGRAPEAEASARAALAADSKNAEAHYLLGTALEDRGDLDGARRAYEETVGLDRNHVAGWNRLQGVDARLGRADEAKKAGEAHREALARQRIEEKVRGHRLRGVEAFNREDFATALSEFQAIARDDPNDPQVHLYLGSSLIALNRLDEARSAIERSLALQPRSERALMELGRLEALQNHLDASVTALRRSIDVNPEFPEPHYFLAGVLTARGDEAGARQEMKRFEELKARTPASAMEIAPTAPGTP